MIIVGTDRRIRQVNPAAMRLMKVRRESDATGKLCHETICQAEVGRCPILDRGREAELDEHVLIDSNGARIPVLKGVSRVTLGGEELLLEIFARRPEHTPRPAP